MKDICKAFKKDTYKDLPDCQNLAQQIGSELKSQELSLKKLSNFLVR